MTYRYRVVMQLSSSEVTVCFCKLGLSLWFLRSEVSKVLQDLEDLRFLDLRVLLCEQDVNSIEACVEKYVIMNDAVLVNFHLILEHFKYRINVGRVDHLCVVLCLSLFTCPVFNFSLTLIRLKPVIFMVFFAHSPLYFLHVRVSPEEITPACVARAIVVLPVLAWAEVGNLQLSYQGYWSKMSRRCCETFKHYKWFQHCFFYLISSTINLNHNKI